MRALCTISFRMTTWPAVWKSCTLPDGQMDSDRCSRLARIPNRCMLVCCWHVAVRCNRIQVVATTVTLDAEIVRAVQRETNEKRKAAAVRLALAEYLRTQRLRRLADLAGKVDLRYTNDELERLEEC